MNEEVILDKLTTTEVNVIRKKYIDIGGKKYYIDDILRRAYVNSISGREEIEEELEEPYLSAVMTVWGNEPIVPEPKKNKGE